MNRNIAIINYEKLFDSEEKKAKAFDKIAEKYYYMNFGSVSKSELDVLMFSIYYEQLLKNNMSNYAASSDYAISKQLGITQTKVSNLKVRKQLTYPYEEFDWKDAFLRISGNAIFEENKIKLFIPDKNIYLEVKNAIENIGGYIEVQLTPNLLQLRLPFFLDLIMALDEETNRNEERNKIKERIEKSSQDIRFIEQQSIGRTLNDIAPDILIEIIGDCIPLFGGAAKEIAKKLFEIIRTHQKPK